MPGLSAIQDDSSDTLGNLQGRLSHSGPIVECFQFAKNKRPFNEGAFPRSRQEAHRERAIQSETL